MNIQRLHSLTPLSSLRYLGLLCVGLMWVVPGLDFRHLLPRATFYPEWDAFALGLAALLPLLSPQSWRTQELPAITLLPAGLILLVLWQLQLGLIPYAGHALTVALYLLWAILLILLGRQLRIAFGLPLLAATLAAFLLAGAELQALSAILQNFRWDTPLNHFVLWTQAERTIINGNLGQANSLSDYLALGLVSLGLLYARGSLRAGLTGLLAAPLLYAMVLSGSRSGWLYLAAFAAASYVWQRRDEALRPLFRYAGWLLPAFVLMHGVAHLPWFAAAGDVSPLEKMSNLGGYAQRLYLWHEAALVFAQSPWLGAGFGQFAWQHFLHSAELRNPIPDVMGSNAHNLVMQLAAETGLAGLVLLVLAVALWYRGQRSTATTLEHGWGYGLLLVLGIHSLLEYPLWYAYFLGIAAITLGLLESHTLRFDLARLGAPLMALILLGGGWELGQLYRANAHLVRLSAPKIEGHPEEYEQRVEAAMKILDADLLMRPYADLFMASSAPFGINDPAVRLHYSEPALRYAPVDTLGYRVAVLLAVQGRSAEAQAMMQRAIWAHPHRFDAVRQAMPWLVLQDPEHLGPLLAYAKQEYAAREQQQAKGK
ncbi:O-antigen ligase family protein [Ferriphaselus sp. R-1]|uniref:PglL family O-oligosaccharyltransferase n=1 Tax=Ferriphaselus sp. R-1 TaxID=1485544 RepID=UPI000555C016|nr:O-antigen ligase family protein [Ferriphaselus sp. R-1]